MSFSTRFLYVGIGGTGLKIGKELERLLREEMCGPDGRLLVSRGGTFSNMEPRQLPDFVQTVYLDFSEQELRSLQSELLPRAPEVARKTATFVNALSAAGRASTEVTSKLRTSEDLHRITKDWLPPVTGDWGNEPAFAPLATGAGQYPTIGRAALFAFMEQFNSETLLRNFSDPLARLSTSVGQLEEYVGATTAARTVVILVGCSVSGGTGGGIFLDVIRLVAHAASRELEGTPYVIVPLVVLPSAFERVLPPAKQRYARLNSIRALADLGTLIDSQNSPPPGQAVSISRYPGASGGGDLEVVLPSATVKTAFLFDRPGDVMTDGELSERVARFAITLLRQPSVSTLEAGPLGGNRTMTLLDRLVNDSGLLQTRHPTFIGRRPFTTTACIAIPDGREQLVQLVSERLLAALLRANRDDLSGDKLAASTRVAETAAELVPPRQAAIDGRKRQEVLQPTLVDRGAVTDAYASYLTAIRQALPQTGPGQDGLLPDHMSAGAAAAYEKAGRYADGTGWVLVLKRAIGLQPDTDLWPMLLGLRDAAAKWKLGQLVSDSKPRTGAPVQFPSPSELLDKQRAGFLGLRREWAPNGEAHRRIKMAEESQVDAAWRQYLKNERGGAVRFKDAADRLGETVGRSIASLTQWLEINNADSIRDREADVIRRYSSAIEFEQLVANTVKALGQRFELADPTEVQVARSILRTRQGQVLDQWQGRDLAGPALLPVRLVEAIREEVGHAFRQPDVYSGIERILRDWAENDETQLPPAVQQFRTRFATLITDSVIPGTVDRDVELRVSVAYPGEQNDDVERRLSQALAKHERLGQFVEQIPPTFVPRAAGDALVISVSLVGQGLMDIPDGASSLQTWVESAFNPNPDDRLAWRQREGYKDSIDFMDAGSRARFIQRLLATAWNGQLTAELFSEGQRDITPGSADELVLADGEPTDRFRGVTLRFGAADAAPLTIPLVDMPFERHLAPLIDAYIREICRQYVVNPQSVSEILRQLAQAVPGGFVERRLPLEGLAKRPLFFEFVQGLNGGGAAARELKWFKSLKGVGNVNDRRVRQIQEYEDFWAIDVAAALNQSFTTTGYGSFTEAIADLKGHLKPEPVG
jgi:hypothetical protein